MARRGARHRETVRPLPQAHRHCRYGGRPRRLHLCPLWDTPVDRHGRRRQAHRPHHVLYGCRGLSPHQEHPALSGQAGGLCRRQLLPLPLFLRHGSAGADESPAAECHLHHLPGGAGRLGAPPPLARTPPGRPAPPAGLPEHPRRLGLWGFSIIVVLDFYYGDFRNQAFGYTLVVLFAVNTVSLLTGPVYDLLYLEACPVRRTTCWGWKTWACSSPCSSSGITTVPAVLTGPGASGCSTSFTPAILLLLGLLAHILL